MKYIQVSLQDVTTGKEVNRLIADSKTFSTGSTGFYAGGKVLLPTGANGDLETYQVSMSIVKVGSKPAKQ